MLLRILLALMIINVIGLLLVQDRKVHLRKALKISFWIIASCFSISISIYYIFPNEKLAEEFFRSGPSYQDSEPKKILIDRYEIVSLSDNELRNMLVKRKTPYILEIHDVKPDHIDRLKNIIKSSNHIESIKLSRLQEKTAERLYSSLVGNTSVINLIIYNCPECITGMTEDIKWPKALKSFTIEHTQISVQAIESINLPSNIENLSIEKCSLNTNSIEMLIPKLPTNIQKLVLSHNQLTSSSITSLLPWLLENKNLVYLDVSYNKITDIGLTNLIESLSKETKVKEIILNRNATTNSFDGKLKKYRTIIKNDEK